MGETIRENSEEETGPYELNRIGLGEEKAGRGVVWGGSCTCV